MIRHATMLLMTKAPIPEKARELPELVPGRETGTEKLIVIFFEGTAISPVDECVSVADSLPEGIY
jgi:hypothetical protein